MKKETQAGTRLPDMDAFTALCHDHGLKLTPQRSEIYRQLLCSRDHPYADSLYRRVNQIFPGISFDTVHRTLQTFAELGLVHVVEGTGIPRRFDPNLDDHHHFWCRVCRRVFDLPAENGKGWLPDMEWANQSGCRVLRARLVLDGVCMDCLQEAENSVDGGRSV